MLNKLSINRNEASKEETKDRLRVLETITKEEDNNIHTSITNIRSYLKKIEEEIHKAIDDSNHDLNIRIQSLRKVT